VTTTLDQRVTAAITELDRWDEPNFTCIQAVLTRHYPEIASYLFDNLTATQGPGAVVGVRTLLERINTLATGEGRPKAARKTDLAALALLAERGYTKDELARIRGLVTVAQTVVVEAPVTDDERTELLRQGYAWISDWSAMAKTVITRRDQLVRLGLAKRRKG